MRRGCFIESSEGDGRVGKPLVRVHLEGLGQPRVEGGEFSGAVDRRVPLGGYPFGICAEK